VEVVIAIPAFNEAGTVGGIVVAACVHAPVLVVDDGSTDATADEARAGGATVVRHGVRRGKGAALATAVTAARSLGARWLVTLDADGQHDPRDLPALLAAAIAAPRAVIIGSRVREDDDTLPRGRALAIHHAGFWLNWVTGAPVADTQSGFRVYPVALFDAVRLRGGRFVFETEVLVEALRRQWQVCEVPIRVVPYAARPSRFLAFGDGAAITSYLTGVALSRWATELGAGLRELGRVFTHERRVARHSRMLAKASAHAGTPSWGVAVAVVAMDEARIRASAWWHHVRARRARRAALATIAAPAALGVAVVVLIIGRLPRMLDRMMRALYDQRVMPALGGESVNAPRVDDEQRAWLPAAPR
jgi:hypothetical protein